MFSNSRLVKINSRFPVVCLTLRMIQQPKKALEEVHVIVVEKAGTLQENARAVELGPVVVHAIIVDSQDTSLANVQASLVVVGVAVINVENTVILLENVPRAIKVRLPVRLDS